MDKDLITRVVLVVVTVALYLVASEVGFHPTIAAPIAVAIVALVMFWPRPREEREQRLPIQLEEQGEK
ncbi:MULTISPECIES: hypothetical protein [unclassified Corynebacterium]|uniref:hypothetical protein n=1 Tax=unclassified Corynebacterium TaxID=2624378 RepID=UPI0008A4AFEF|nr:MULTISPECIES: hypothetical protein [unclassified Corynebacterium]OFP34703.1 hypothetical protein HMPREF2990_09810 [Corynebacterium sp. HMSC071B10]OHF36147.1 hypothetical protein HMPREF2550_09275 [Corynebacterium sp. HMSC074A01]